MVSRAADGCMVSRGPGMHAHRAELAQGALAAPKALSSSSSTDSSSSIDSSSSSGSSSKVLCVIFACAHLPMQVLQVHQRTA